MARPIPPHDLVAEQSTLGAILVRPDLLGLVADSLAPGDFYRGAHGHIYQAMLDLYGRGEPVDLVSVSALLKERGQLEGVGGSVFLASLSKQVGFATNIDYYARVIWEKSQTRKIKAKAAQILEQNPNGNFGDFCIWAESQIFEVTRAALNRTSQFQPLATVPKVSEIIKQTPAPREFIFRGLFPKHIVSATIAQGGTGKGHHNIFFGLLLATGKKAGQLEPTGRFKVVYLAGEDKQEELNRRVYDAVKTLWPEGSPPAEVDNLIPISIMGRLDPLMKLDGAGNPTRTSAFDWITRFLESIPDLDILILDPKSKFYGLVENDNGHNAAWINCLESLVEKFKINVHFCHHESKARAGSLDQASSRGGGALTDGCRWVANLKSMDDKTAGRFKLPDPHNYLIMDVTKSNYTPKLPGPIYFRRGAGGALAYADLATERAKSFSNKLFDLLVQEEAVGHQHSRRDLLYGDTEGVKAIITGLKDGAEGFNRVRDISLAVDYLLGNGWLQEKQVQGAQKGPRKTILKTVAPES
jgi:hypothetical protein